jgi:hypothetical protein
MWSLGHGRRGSGRNPARVGGGTGRGRRGGGLGVARGRIAGLVGARSGWWGGHAGGQGRWPPRLPVPARGGSGGASRRAVARAREGGGRFRLACGRPELELAAAGPRAPEDGSVRRGGPMCVADRGSGSLLRRRADPLRTCGRAEGASGTCARQDDGGRTAGP